MSEQSEQQIKADKALEDAMLAVSKASNEAEKAGSKTRYQINRAWHILNDVKEWKITQ